MTDRLKLVSIAALSIGVASILFLLDPARVAIFPSCPFYRMTGLWCPGCGATRALHQLVHGQLAAAFRFNPLAILLLPAVAYLAVRGERISIKPLWIWTLLGMVVVFAVLRNIPAYPWTLLAP